MADETEQNLESPIVQPAADAVAKAGQFVETSKQNTWTEATEANRTTLKDSTTMESLTDEKIAEIKDKGGFQKFEVFEGTQPTEQGLQLGNKTISDKELLGGFIVLAILYLTGLYTGFLILKVFSFLPVVYLIMFYYLNRKEFIRLKPVLNE